ncbi:MAG: SpoIIE family protein phosphatase [Turneriella sp.]|nr:SpoIIE family protein phosphatase [Turneriella sp.]
MSRYFWSAAFLLLFAGIFAELWATYQFITDRLPAVLTTPHGLALIPLAFELPPGSLYLHHLSNLPARGFRPIEALLPIYAGAFFFWFTGLFVYVFSRIRRLERAYVLFSLFVVLYFLLFLDFFTWNYTANFFLYYNVLVIAPFLYLYRSSYQLPTQGWLYLLILVASFALILFFPVRSAADELAFSKLINGCYLATLLYCAWIFVRGEITPQTPDANKSLWAARIFSFSLIFSVALPPAFFFALTYFPVAIDISYNALFFLPVLFTVVFITLSLRWGLIHFQIPVSLTAVRIFYFAFFSLLYWFTVGFSLGEIYLSRILQWSQVLALILFLLLMDPLRTALLLSLDSYAATRQRVLDAIFLRSSGQIANPRQADRFIERTALLLTEGLGCYQAKVVFSEALFSNWHSESRYIIYLPDDDPFWAETRGWLRGRSYPLFTQVFFGPVRDFLRTHGGFMLVAMQNFKAAIMVSERRDGLPYYGEDVRFLRQVARAAEMLIRNYLFLIENVKLRRRERELEDNARIQRRLIPQHRQFDRLVFRCYSRAYASVTGDYIDLVPLAADHFMVFLGDVSGHGISSGYLVSFIRAYLRGAVTTGQTLREAINNLNSYFVENYRGSEFVTLFALDIGFDNAAVLLSYINAGQHPALLFNQGRLAKLSGSQRLLGVISGEYQESQQTITPPARLLLFSDGAFEIFNRAGKMLGEEKLTDWILASVNKTIEEQFAFLRQKIEYHLKTSTGSDDLTLVIMELR